MIRPKSGSNHTTNIQTSFWINVIPDPRICNNAQIKITKWMIQNIPPNGDANNSIIQKLYNKHVLI